MIIEANENNLCDLIEIESQFFGGNVSESPPITKEEYALFLKMGGRALIRYQDGKPSGLLAYIKASNIGVEVEALDRNSVLSRNYQQKEILEKYSDYLLIFSWAGLNRGDAVLFREAGKIGKKLFGFVDLDSEQAVDRYVRSGGVIKELISGLYVPGKTHAVIVYERE